MRGRTVSVRIRPGRLKRVSIISLLWHGTLTGKAAEFTNLLLLTKPSGRRRRSGNSNVKYTANRVLLGVLSVWAFESLPCYFDIAFASVGQLAEPAALKAAGCRFESGRGQESGFAAKERHGLPPSIQLKLFSETSRFHCGKLRQSIMNLPPLRFRRPSEYPVAIHAGESLRIRLGLGLRACRTFCRLLIQRPWRGGIVRPIRQPDQVPDRLHLFVPADNIFQFPVNLQQ